jgi:hypothetical protein
MKPELIAIVKQLKEKKEAQDVYFQTIPTDLRVSVIDNNVDDTPMERGRRVEAKLKEKNT